MKKEMDRAWKDFFDRNVPPRGAQYKRNFLFGKPCPVGWELQKNPDKKEEDVWRRIEGNLFPFLGKEIEALV